MRPVPGEKGSRAQQHIAREFIDIAVCDSVEQGLDIAVEHACEDARQRFRNGVAEQAIDLAAWAAEQTQQGLTGLGVTRATQNMQAPEKKPFVVQRQNVAIGGPCENRPQRRGGLLDPDGANADSESRHPPLGRQGMQVAVYRIQLEVVVAVTEEFFQLFFFHHSPRWSAVPAVSIV